MTVTIEHEALTSDVFAFDPDALIRRVIAGALSEEKCPYDAAVEVILTDNERIHAVNLEQRNVDRPTDVLSFPMAEYAFPADFAPIAETQRDVFDPDTGEFVMGDIMISVDKVREQAALYGHSEERELGFLVAHSMLHLMGYDHMEEEERILMEERQRLILNALGITR